MRGLVVGRVKAAPLHRRNVQRKPTSNHCSGESHDPIASAGFLAPTSANGIQTAEAAVVKPIASSAVHLFLT
jgi:hypothetical protein